MDRQRAGVAAGLGVGIATFIVVTALSGQSVPDNGSRRTPGGLASGRYYAMPNAGTAVSTSALLTNSVLRCMPVPVPNRITIARMMAGITAIGDVGSKLRLCLYNADGSGRPGTLILDAGTIAGDSATDQEIVFDGLSGRPSPTAIGSGTVNFCGVVQNVTTTQPTVRTVAGVAGDLPVNVDFGTTMPTSATSGFSYVMNGVTGACPATFVYAATGTTAPRIMIKTQ